jgi:hypothetical protein
MGLLPGQAFVQDPGLSAAEVPLSRGRPQEVGNAKPCEREGCPAARPFLALPAMIAANAAIPERTENAPETIEVRVEGDAALQQPLGSAMILTL